MTDPETKNDTFAKKPIELYSFDCHPTKLLRDTYNTNLKLLIHTAFFNFLFIYMYRDWWTVSFALFTGLVPVIVNLAIVILKEE